MQSKSSTLRLTIISVLAVACLIFSQIEEDRSIRKLEEKEDEADEARPTMYTFFEPVNGLGDKFNDPMIEEWKYEWERIGFQTKVLTLADAEKHPYFQTMKEEVKKPFPNDTYNQYCFYRYLAMAASGGGWMSDNDTFPMDFDMEEATNLPNEGKFTSFQSHVPALISASADEWARVAQIMTESIASSTQNVKSDMYILYEIKITKQASIHDIKLMPQSYVNAPNHVYSEPHKIDCKEMEGRRAIHMSHFGLDTVYRAGKYPIAAEYPLGSKARAEGARVIMDDWREQCDSGGSKKVEAVQ